MGAFKWKTLRPRIQAGEYRRRPTAEQVQAASKIFRARRMPGTLTHKRGDVTWLANRRLIGSQPILALFLAVGVGYASGRSMSSAFRSASVRCCSSASPSERFAPKAQIAGPIGLIGLVMFLYGIGMLYGRQFFEGLAGPGRRYNLAGLRRHRGGASGGACARPGVRRRDRPYAGPLCWLHDEHADLAGSARRPAATIRRR